MTELIITCNINAYNVEGAFDKLDTIDWKQSTYVEKGDMVRLTGLMLQILMQKQ